MQTSDSKLQMVDLSIIIVTFNSEGCIAACLSSIKEQVKQLKFETLVVDNNSSDDTIAAITCFKDVRLVRSQKNQGFAAANNLALKEAKGEYILVLNPDMVLSENTEIAEAISFMKSSTDVGLASIKLLYEDGRIQESARRFPSAFTFLIRGLKLERIFYRFSFYRSKFFKAGIEADPIEVDWVIGAFMIIKKELMETLGGFDRKYFMYYEDADLCLRVKKHGFKIVYLPFLSAIHSYKRESAKPVFSKLKWIHLKSFVRFLFRLKIAKNHI